MFLSVLCLVGPVAGASMSAPITIEMDQDHRVYYMDGVASPIIEKVVEVMLKDVVSAEEYQNVIIRRAAKNLFDLPTTSLYSVDLDVIGWLQKCEMPTLRQYDQKNAAALNEFRENLYNKEFMNALSMYKNRPRMTTQMRNDIEAEFLQCGVDLVGQEGCSVNVSVDRLTGNDFEKTYTALLTTDSCPVLKTLTDLPEVKVNFRKTTATTVEVF